MMSTLALPELLRGNKSLILKEMKERMSQLPVSKYRDFLVNTEEGQKRMTDLTDMVINAIGGDDEPFLEDQERVGYCRAIQGVRLEAMCHVYRSFRQTFYKLVQQSVRTGPANDLELLDKWEGISKVLFDGYVVVASSYMRSREEQINEKITILRKLQDFAQQIVITFELPAIVNLAEKEISSLFGVAASVAIFSDGRIAGVSHLSTNERDAELARLMIRSWKRTSNFFVGEEGEICTDVNKSRLKRIVTVPIQAHGRVPGVLALYDLANGFQFAQKDLRLLRQFVHFMALAFENAFMVEEIEQSRKELRLLTDKVLTIREQERKRLAADIHDTLAQALTGIGYKIRFCAELTNRFPERVADELESLTNTVHHAVDQCRNLISSLRPDLIDTLGLVPALRKLFHIYTESTGVRISAHLPKKVKLPPDVSICLYRVAQEALTNVYKHGAVAAAEVKLTNRNGNIVLTVSDKGKGFDISSYPTWISDSNKVGLLYARERIESVGGTLVINTGIGSGCTLEARIPSNVKGGARGHDQSNDR